MRHNLSRWIRIALLAAATTGWLAGAARASGFVYTAVPAAPCATESPCAPPHVLVVDADTAEVVMRIPLPVHTQPAGMAISPDGAHLYVSNRAAELSGATSMTVIDARRHRLIASYPLSTAEAGVLAVRGDDSRVFIASAQRLSVFDTATHDIADSVQIALYNPSIVAGTGLDRVFVAERTGLGGGTLSAFDAGTLAPQGHVNMDFGRLVLGLTLSKDERRLLVTQSLRITGPFNGGTLVAVDPATMAIVSTSGGSYFTRGDPAEVPSTGQILVPVLYSVMSRNTVGFGSIALPGQAQAITVPPGDARAFVTTAFDTGLNRGIEALAAIDLATGVTARTIPLSPLATPYLTSTPRNVQACSYRLDSPYGSSAVTGGSATVRLTTGCDWEASSDQPWAQLATSGSGSTEITVTVDPNVLPTPRVAILTIAGQLVTVTQAGGNSDAPFGVVDTPADGLVGVTGALAITGWALDDVGVSGVRIFRDPLAGEGPGLIYVGAAALVEGARPDVAALMPALPYATRAGWGLQVLTNGLPNGGSGTYRLWAFADDVEGHLSLLGSRTFTAANDAATRPFGAIDTPGPGETVSGTIANFGWGLTPAPGVIPADGSTIDVVIDGRVMGHPAYGLFRADIAALFPGYANAAGAVGYFVLDTTGLANGLHTIAWIVRDDLGRPEGIGSRFFRVFNP